MKIINISLVGLLAFAAMPASALFNPFSWFKVKSPSETRQECASDLKEIAENLKPFREKAHQNTKLQRLYNIADELENFAKIRQALNAEENSVEDAFLRAQKQWGLNDERYSYNNVWLYRHRRIVRNPDVEEAEKEAGISARPAPVSWYEQLEKKMNSLPESELKKSVEDRKKEFKIWQQNRNRAR